MVMRPLFDPGLHASSGSYLLAFILQAGSAYDDLSLYLFRSSTFHFSLLFASRRRPASYRDGM